MRRPLVLVLAAAALLRVAAWLLLSRTPFFAVPVVDASSFDIWARDLLAGGGMMDNDAWFKPPLYPYLLAGLYAVSGASLVFVQALQMLAGIALAGLTLVVGRRVAPPGVALAGGLIAAVLPMLPFFEFQLLAEPWTTLLTLLALERLLTGGRQTPPSAGRTALAGLLLGLAALGRPNLLLTVAAAAVWLAWADGRPRLPRRALPLLLAALLPLLGSTLRNASVSGDFVPVSANLGANLVTGHHDGADGVTAIPVGLLWDDLQLECRQAGQGSAAASSRFLVRRAVGWMAEHPGRTLELLGRKALALVSGWEIRNNIGPQWLAREHGVWLLARWWPSTWLLLPFALAGAGFACRGRGWALLLAVAAVQAASVLPFFVNARFRQPLLPLLALFAAAGGALLWRRWRESDRRGLAAPLAALLLAGVVVNVDWLDLSAPRRNAEDAFNEGLIHLRGYRGLPVDGAAAETAFRRALELDPDFADAHERYGVLRLSRAQAGLARVQADLRRGDGPPVRALAARVEQELDAAAASHRRALELVPRSYRSAANLGAADLLAGELHASLAAAAADPAAADRERALARERYERAQAFLGRALRLNPGFGEARSNARLLESRLAALAAEDR